MSTAGEQHDVTDEQLADVPQMGGRLEPGRVGRRAQIGRFLGPVVTLAGPLLGVSLTAG